MKKRIPPPRPKRPDLSRTASKKTIGTLSYKPLTSDEEPSKTEESKSITTVQEIPIEEPKQEPKPLAKSTDSIEEKPPTITSEPIVEKVETTPTLEPIPTEPTITAEPTTDSTTDTPTVDATSTSEISDTPENPPNTSDEEERELDPHRRSSFRTLRLQTTTTVDKPTSETDRPVTKKMAPPIIESIEPFPEEISEGIFKTEQDKRKSGRNSEMNINLQVTLQVKVPVISETRQIAVGFHWTVERVIDKIKSELFPLLVQYDLSTFDLGYYNPDFPDYLVFLNHAVTIGECKLDKVEMDENS